QPSKTDLDNLAKDTLALKYLRLIQVDSASHPLLLRMLHSPALESLRLEHCDLPEDQLLYGKKQSKLRRIICHQCRLTNKNVAAIGALPGLKWLDVYDPHTEDGTPLDYSPLQDSPALYHLTIRDKRLSDPGWIAKCEK